MIKFLLFFLIGFFLLPAFIIWKMMRSVRKNLRKTQQQSSSRQQRYEPEPTQGRVFSDIEEDVEFESVEGPRVEVERPTYVKQEDQITDAEFEEVNE